MNFDILNDKEYIEIVSDILNSDNFKKLKYIKHHNSNRYSHLLRVSYASYRLALKEDLDYKSVARGALLHDYFFTDNTKLDREGRLHVLFNHPLHALYNAKKEFKLNKIEEDIIISHMYPVNISWKPKYKESKLVDKVDNIISILEFSNYTKRKLKNFLFSFIYNRV